MQSVFVFLWPAVVPLCLEAVILHLTCLDRMHMPVYKVWVVHTHTPPHSHTRIESASPRDRETDTDTEAGRSCA